jgi:tetratricopeptide (TPR) repeat protein
LSIALASFTPLRSCAAAPTSAALFAEALAAPTFQLADDAWSRLLSSEPRNTLALANRGTLRLQNRKWAEAAADLSASVELEGGLATASPVAVNNLGNALAALGEWEGALLAYQSAADAPASRRSGLSAIARANSALVSFQLGRSDAALDTLRALLRKDPEFWDARAASAAFLWASGASAEAEAAWDSLCRAGRGFGAPRSAEEARADGKLAFAGRLLSQQLAQQAGAMGVLPVRDSRDDTPCRLYRDLSTVEPRWPPRATAALDAFLRVSREGSATGYGGEPLHYDFGQGY